MSTNQSMDDFFHNFKDLVDQLNNIELILPEELFVVLILNSLPRTFRGYVQSIMNMESLPSIRQIESKLSAEEMCMKLENGNTSNIGANDEAMMVSTRTRPNQYLNERRGHSHTLHQPLHRSPTSGASTWHHPSTFAPMLSH